MGRLYVRTTEAGVLWHLLQTEIEQGKRAESNIVAYPFQQRVPRNNDRERMDAAELYVSLELQRAHSSNHSR